MGRVDLSKNQVIKLLQKPTWPVKLFLHRKYLIDWQTDLKQEKSNPSFFDIHKKWACAQTIIQGILLETTCEHNTARRYLNFFLIRERHLYYTQRLPESSTNYPLAMLTNGLYNPSLTGQKCEFAVCQLLMLRDVGVLEVARLQDLLCFDTVPGHCLSYVR